MYNFEVVAIFTRLDSVRAREVCFHAWGYAVIGSTKLVVTVGYANVTTVDESRKSVEGIISRSSKIGADMIHIVRRSNRAHPGLLRLAREVLLKPAPTRRTAVVTRWLTPQQLKHFSFTWFTAGVAVIG